MYAQRRLHADVGTGRRGELAFDAHFFEPPHHIRHALDGFHLFAQRQGVETPELRKLMLLPGASLSFLTE